MHRALRDGPGLIGDLWDRQTSLVTEAAACRPTSPKWRTPLLQASLQDLLPAIPRELCRRLGFRRGRLWLASPGEAPLHVQLAAGVVGEPPRLLTRLARRGAPWRAVRRPSR